jgi:cytochrome c553
MKYFKLTLFLMIYISSNTLFAADENPFTQALSLEGNIENGKKVYRLCAACHLKNGWGKSNGSFPVLAGQHKSVIIKQLKNIQDKKRQNPTMSPFSDPETIGGKQSIADVATYIASMPSMTQHGQGDGKAIKKGQAIYQAKCTACHGKKGEGNGVTHIPKLSQQHYHYLLRQLKWIRDGLRQNSDPVMVTQIKKLSDDDLAAVADYISRL